ncbi:DUF4372 domain-containing protein [Arachidicoccus sp.]|uniref:DUF4372 domain-containing protein n=1 Tax=Arachidicoccus sp. TaxID=1872624 RepID=UPI003D20C837
MHSCKYIFSQIIALISPRSFKTIVDRHSGDYKAQKFTCWKQVLCMAFGQSLTISKSFYKDLVNRYNKYFNIRFSPKVQSSNQRNV